MFSFAHVLRVKAKVLAGKPGKSGGFAIEANDGATLENVV
uniref:Uncharacterized protein n=1 Tax=Marseillevirus LCMAC103 TaxID=2506604 RepID=A0A481YVJ6_9VIRU|nr:MAG: hypothetical protein LCMAC103_02650 [Marseillevirus LCMAC103]